MKMEILEDSAIDDLVEIFRALGDPVRLRIMLRLTHGMSSVSELNYVLDLDTEKTLEQVRILEKLDLIKSCQRHHETVYCLRMSCIAQMCRHLGEGRGEEAGDCC